VRDRLPCGIWFSTVRPMSANSSSRIGCLGVFLVLLLCLSLFFNALFLIGEFFIVHDEPKFRERQLTGASGKVGTKVAVMRLDGLIANSMPGYIGDSMVEDIKLQLKQALDDQSVRAIVIAIDSPGGEVTASDAIYQAIRKAREKKPVVISMGSLAASGGYYAAVGGSHIFAHETTFTGSIGVIMQSLNYKDAMGKVGLEMVTFKSGEFKDMLSGSKKMSPEEAEYVQKMVMQTYSKFVGIVAAERKLDEQTLRAGLADGRVISGKDAQAARLIDEIGDLDAAIAKAITLGNAPGSAVVKYETPAGIGRLIRMLGTAEQPKKIEINVGVQAALPLKPGYQYLLPSMMVP
jgi:protease IV